VAAVPERPSARGETAQDGADVSYGGQVAVAPMIKLELRLCVRVAAVRRARDLIGDPRLARPDGIVLLHRLSSQ